MKANERQVGGTHYATDGGLQHWDVVAAFNLDYFQGQITKYVMRWKLKGGFEDLKKAEHFLEKYIELESERLATAVKAEQDMGLSRPLNPVETNQIFKK